MGEPGVLEQEVRQRLAHALDATAGLRANLDGAGQGAERAAIEVLARTLSALSDCVITLARVVDGLSGSAPPGDRA